MLSGVLNSPRAIQVNIAIMRAFVRLRHILASHADLARKLEERRDDLSVLFARQYNLPPEECVRAAVVLMGTLAEESLEQLQSFCGSQKAEA